MSIYDLKIAWQIGTETLSIDTLDLPNEGDELLTFETRPGANRPVKYVTDVRSVVRSDNFITIMLSYDSAKNKESVDDNDALGDSHIELDLSGPNATATATWTDNEMGHLYDGAAKVKCKLVKSRSLTEDLFEILKESRTERETMVLSRLGQGKFRAAVIDAWKLGERCPLTNIEVPELLVASHIKPWSECNDVERLDGANGLLLATHVDKLFDKHLVSFEWAQGVYRLRLNPRVSDEARKLGITEDAVLDPSNLGPREKSFRAYMKGHHARFKEKICT
jgi:hypothetical protein